HHLEDAEQALLNRMLPAKVAFERSLEMKCQGEEAGMLARAVVVECAALFALPGQSLECRQVARRLRPALQIVLAQADPFQPGLHGGNLIGLSIMAGAGPGNPCGAAFKGRRPPPSTGRASSRASD